MSEDRELLIEAFCSAYRDSDLDGNLAASPAWHDLDAAGRIEAAKAAAQLRTMEAALDPHGLSSTGHAVLAKIRAAGR